MQDLIWLAKSLKAKGETNICMTISTSNSALGANDFNALARQCYEACIAAGYEPHEITIKAPDDKHHPKVVCGIDDSDKDKKRIPPLELIGNAETLKRIHEMGDRVRQAEKNALDPGRDQKHYKDRVNALRALGSGTPTPPTPAPVSLTIKP